MEYLKIIREIPQKINKLRTIWKINKLNKKELTSLAMNLAEKYFLFHKEIEAYIRFHELYGKNINSAIDKITPKKEFAEKIANKTIKNPELNDSSFREIYYFKEEMSIKKELTSFITYKPSFNDLFITPNIN